MLQLTNAEGSKFNSLLDEYLCIHSTEETLANVTYEELVMIHELVGSFDSHTLVVECDKKTQELIRFLDNIGKLIILNEKHLGSYCYYTVQKSLLDFELN